MDMDRAGLKDNVIGALCWVGIFLFAIGACLVAGCIKLAEIPGRTQPLRAELREKMLGLGSFLAVLGYLFIVEPLEHLWMKIQRATPETHRRMRA